MLRGSVGLRSGQNRPLLSFSFLPVSSVFYNHIMPIRQLINLLVLYANIEIFLSTIGLYGNIYIADVHNFVWVDLNVKVSACSRTSTPTESKDYT